MIRNDPFSRTNLNEIFKFSPTKPDWVNSRESSTFEFKQSFGLKSLPEYARVCASFANAKGGYIVFGIGDQPHKMIGLQKNALSAFENLAPDKVSGYLNDHFSGEIHWEVNIHEIDNLKFGILYIHESSKKTNNLHKEFRKRVERKRHLLPLSRSYSTDKIP